MKTRKIIVGNWKMNPATPEEAEKIFKSIERNSVSSKSVEAVICPSFAHLSLVARLNKKRKITLGAQNISDKEKGSFTGEVSADMIKNLGCRYVILGHSERRKIGETDELINAKLHLALKTGLTPIICIGEEKRDEEGHYLTFIRQQIEKGLKRVIQEQLKNVVIAYEPVFAVGAAQAMNASDVHGMTIFIKKVLIEIFRTKNANVPVLYGGAVDPTNAYELLTVGDADGFLMGRQSLEAKGFLEILDLAKSKK